MFVSFYNIKLSVNWFKGVFKPQTRKLLKRKYKLMLFASYSFYISS